jgi:hypothetical protein
LPMLTAGTTFSVLIFMRFTPSPYLQVLLS